MKAEKINPLLDQLIKRLSFYRLKKAYVSYPPLEFDLEQRIKELENQVETLRNLPPEQQSEINNEELNKILDSLPLDLNEFEWQKFDKTRVNINIIINQIEREKKINSVLTKLPYNEAFEGRKKELAELKEQISTQKNISLTSINGIGGIGKSALSKAFFLENYKEYDFALFLEGKSNVYDTFNNYTLLDNLEIAEKVNSIPYQTPNRNEIIFDIIKNALSNLEGKKLLLIDDASENSHLLKDLIQSDWEILTTSRQKIDFMYSFELQQATPEDAIAIFCVYYGKTIENLSKEEKAQIQRLVNRLALHPLAIELVAKNIKRKDWTFEETNQKLAEKGLNIDEKTNLTTTHSQEKIKDIFEYLLQLFPLENLTEEELKLLNVYSVLPNLPITKQTWKTLLGEDEDHWQELSTGLNERGLINKDGKAFEIHALLAEIVRYKNEDRLDEDYEKMMISLNGLFDWRDNYNYHKENYRDALQYKKYAQSIIKYVEDSEAKGILCNRLGSFYVKTGYIYEAEQMYSKAYFIYHNLDKKYTNNPDVTSGIAISCSKLGEIYQELGEPNKALQCFMIYNNMIEILFIDFPFLKECNNSLAVSYSRLGEVYQSLGNFKMALHFYEKYHHLEKNCCNMFPNDIIFMHGLAISYSKLGETHQKLGNLSEALKFFKENNNLEETYCKQFPNDINLKISLAISYQFLGNIHFEIGNQTQDFTKALYFYRKQVESYEKLYSDYSMNIDLKSGLACSHVKLFSTYRKINQNEKSKSHIKESVRLFKELAKDFPNYPTFARQFEDSSKLLKQLQ
ncbi:NB-ARC domain-containing protein [Bernardetia sp. ABR2-2B]|uniref:tetratricopeptide repeat protein n=1 Tax=Bernardetia sp. ABR2-2B TaxID=3127472 RepID=UPI0030CC27CC